ncbi:MAG TPA: UDP-N-acetylmuramate:L-alanyl-gamma-D-glutamyl-meso-diaminopimelate ligase [Vicinamibacteria bacterium]|nr:UDP-N-acetylmuramate:L-alanyl-gamma-D-glutamyl-meso-diaminopimelate ligase [Vicinamibacteria bacterium]
MIPLLPAPSQGRIHLLGICGTAMASLAGMLHEKGYRVSGSDQDVYPPMSEMLDRLGITVHSPYRPENLAPDLDLVVVGNAISRGNPELEEVLDRGLPFASMPEVTKELFLRSRRSVVVAGTHGKTTTTSLMSWVLQRSKRDPSFLVGGIPLNFGKSYRLGEGECFVIEGDEYDTAYFDKGPKFLHYLPQLVVLGNVEYDHADIYPDLDSVAVAFRRLVNLIPRRGSLLVGAGSPLAMDIAKGAFCRVESFALEAPATWQARAVRVDGNGSRFEVWKDGNRYGEMAGPFWGGAALTNALAVVATAQHLGLGAEEIAPGLSSFRGVARRLEVRGEEGGVMVVDDFAHHPTAIRQTVESARLRWPQRRLWAIFEPRSYTARSQVFQRAFAEALGAADAVILAGVYSSSRLPAEKELSEERVVEDLRRLGVEAWFIPEVKEIVSFLTERLRADDVVLGMSNGAFGGFHEMLLQRLSGKV